MSTEHIPYALRQLPLYPGEAGDFDLPMFVGGSSLSWTVFRGLSEWLSQSLVAYHENGRFSDHIMGRKPFYQDDYALSRINKYSGERPCVSNPIVAYSPIQGEHRAMDGWAHQIHNSPLACCEAIRVTHWDRAGMRIT